MTELSAELTQNAFERCHYLTEIGIAQLGAVGLTAQTLEYDSHVRRFVQITRSQIPSRVTFLRSRPSQEDPAVGLRYKIRRVSQPFNKTDGGMFLHPRTGLYMAEHTTVDPSPRTLTDIADEILTLTPDDIRLLPTAAEMTLDRVDSLRLGVAAIVQSLERQFGYEEGETGHHAYSFALKGGESATIETIKSSRKQSLPSRQTTILHAWTGAYQSNQGFKVVCHDYGVPSASSRDVIGSADFGPRSSMLVRWPSDVEMIIGLFSQLAEHPSYAVPMKLPKGVSAHTRAAPIEQDVASIIDTIRSRQ